MTYRISLPGCAFAAVLPIGACTRLAGWLLLVMALQLTLGISNVVFSLPLAAVAHNGVAALLLLTTVALVHIMGQEKYRS